VHEATDRVDEVLGGAHRLLAPLRSAVEAGRFELVGPQRGEEAVCAAEDFVDAARDLVLGGVGAVAGRALSMRVQRAS